MNIELAQKLIKTKIKLLMHIRGMNKSEIAEQLHGWSRPAVDHYTKTTANILPYLPSFTPAEWYNPRIYKKARKWQSGASQHI